MPIFDGTGWVISRQMEEGTRVWSAIFVSVYCAYVIRGILNGRASLLVVVSGPTNLVRTSSWAAKQTVNDDISIEYLFNRKKITVNFKSD